MKIALPGLLSQRITLLTPRPTRTDSGGFVTSYDIGPTVLGQVTTPQKGGVMVERIVGSEANVGELAELILQLDGATLTGDMQLEHNGSRYEIVQIQRQSPFAWVLGRVAG